VLAGVTFPPDLYRDWRQQSGAASAFRDARPQGAPPERWLQELWAHQRLQRESLRTTENRRVVILHPGFWNHEAGPDFTRAVIQFDDHDPISGDIEIDLYSSLWKSHGHANNQAYANVVLHVVWEPKDTPPLLPTLALKDQLDGPVEELESWVGGAGEMPIEWLAGQCSAPLRRLAPDDVVELLGQAAMARLQTKALQFRARGRAAGWHQALWEGVFRALGYKHNTWPMQRLAELIPTVRSLPETKDNPRELWEARLLGLSGMLPAEPKAGTYGRRLWDLWWRDRDPLRSQMLPQPMWRLNGVRPANHPQRRLALAGTWLADPAWPERVEQWFHGNPPAAEAERTLAAALRPTTHGFWKRHYTLNARELPDALPLLGSGRLNDLAVNVVLPWLWARTEAGGDLSARQRVEALYLHWSPGEDNAVLKLVKTRLFGEEPLPGNALPPCSKACSKSSGISAGTPTPCATSAGSQPWWRPGPRPT
jgi:hypothetical protein